MLVGIAVGLVVGILPGLGGAATLAMMLPFVYPMDAISAFAFLWACTRSRRPRATLYVRPLRHSRRGGKSAATVLDGIDDAAREGGRGWARCSSRRWSAALLGAVGPGCLGARLLARRSATGAARIPDADGPGLSFIVSLAGRNLVKGSLMAEFGFLLAMWGSILRAASSALLRAVVISGKHQRRVRWRRPLRRRRGAAVMMTKHSIRAPWRGCAAGWRDAGRARHLRPRGLRFGHERHRARHRRDTGMGGAVSQFIAYAHAQHTRSTPKRSGGERGRRLATGAVNNSREGGNLIPTVCGWHPGQRVDGNPPQRVLLKGLVPAPPC